MVEKICPMMKTKCIKEECKWYITRENIGKTCAIVSIANDFSELKNKKGQIRVTER